MVRTTLLQKVLQLSNKAQKEFYEENMEKNYSRRTFLKGIGAVAIASALPSFLVSPIATKAASGGRRIAVVGAGLAGLSCAYRLKQAGISAEIFESNNRVGGRCWSLRNYFNEEQIAEHGGELIDQSHTNIRQLAQELGLVLDNLKQAEQNGTEEFLYFMNEKYDINEATTDLKGIWQKLHSDLSSASYPTRYYSSTQRGRELDAMSIDQWINESVPGGLSSKLGKLLSIAYNIEYGEETNNQSSLNLIYLLGYSGQGQMRIFGPSNEKFHIRGGNDQIVSKLSEQLTNQIQLNTALKSISKNKDETYTLTFSNGQTKIYDYVVLTIPFSILKTAVNYTNAGFSAKKIKAITELGMSANTKLNIQFTNRHWRTLGNNGDSYSDTGYQTTWEVTRAQQGTSGILVDYTGGKVAKEFESGSVSTHVTNFLSRSSTVFPGLAGYYNGKAYINCWSTNQWTKGAYSYYKPGQYVAFGGAEGEREGNCFFAGEHTSQDFQGYLNGAVETGEKVAAELARELNKLIGSNSKNKNVLTS